MQPRLLARLFVALFRGRLRWRGVAAGHGVAHDLLGVLREVGAEHPSNEVGVVGNGAAQGLPLKLSEIEFNFAARPLQAAGAVGPGWVAGVAVIVECVEVVGEFRIFFELSAEHADGGEDVAEGVV